MRKKRNPRFAKQDGRSSSEKLRKRLNSQNRKKNESNTSLGSTQIKTLAQGVALQVAGEGPAAVGGWKGRLGTQSRKDPKPTGTEVVESVVWPSGKEGRLVKRGLLTEKWLKTRSIWKGPFNALNSCQAN